MNSDQKPKLGQSDLVYCINVHFCYAIVLPAELHSLVCFWHEQINEYIAACR